MEWTVEDSDAALAEGWDIFYCSGQADGDRYQLQRDDEAEIFKDDAQAHRHVREMARMKSPLHERAMEFLLRNQPSEHSKVLDA